MRAVNDEQSISDSLHKCNYVLRRVTYRLIYAKIVRSKFNGIYLILFNKN